MTTHRTGVRASLSSRSPRSWPLRLWAALRRWTRIQRERETLANLDDHQLRDIGLDRADVEREIRRPPWDIDGRR